MPEVSRIPGDFRPPQNSGANSATISLQGDKHKECAYRPHRAGEDPMKRIKDRGFTLVEVLVALFILSVGLLAMSAMVVSVMRATAQGKETTTAATLLQDKMESLKNSGISSLTSGSDSPAVGNITYSRQWNISSANNLTTITVNVNWIDRSAHSVSAATLRGQ